jgi:SAM-dependent methyltransferase
MSLKYKELYDDKYFENRNSTDLNRLKSFEQEKEFIYQYIKEGTICDIGCSTGEFLNHIKWNGQMYGMEINEDAIKIAKNSGISFDKNILTENNFFDVVVFRGTIQHVPNPFFYIEKAYDSLKDGGYIVFLATPNMNSLYYKFFNTLPMLDDPRNFYIPSDKTLSNALKNFRFEIIEIDKPYLKSPYSNVVNDHLKFFKKLLFRTDDKFAFWGNSINIIARKKI